jgi:hypothetical protein
MSAICGVCLNNNVGANKLYPIIRKNYTVQQSSTQSLLSAAELFYINGTKKCIGII